MNSWWRCRLMQRPITVPSRILSAANRVVVPLRLLAPNASSSTLCLSARGKEGRVAKQEGGELCA